MIMALSRPNPNPKSDYGIVAAKPKFQILLGHCCRKAQIPNLTIFLLQTHHNSTPYSGVCLQPSPNPHSDHIICCSKTQFPNLFCGMVATKPQFQSLLGIVAAKLNHPHLTMFLLQPTYDYGIVVAEPYPKYDYGIVAATQRLPNLTMALLHPNHNQILTMALLPPKTISQI